MGALKELVVRIGDAVNRSRFPVARSYPGEFERKKIYVDPRNIVQSDPMSPEEQRAKIGAFYGRIKARTGVTIPNTK